MGVVNVKVRALDIRIEIARPEEVMKDVALTMYKISKGEKVEPEPKTLVFPNLQTLRSILTDERIRLLSLVREKKPVSVNALAKLAKRKYANVFVDVKNLGRLGLVKLVREKGSTKPIMPYHSLHIEVPLTAKATAKP